MTHEMDTLSLRESCQERKVAEASRNTVNFQGMAMYLQRMRVVANYQADDNGPQSLSRTARSDRRHDP